MGLWRRIDSPNGRPIKHKSPVGPVSAARFFQRAKMPIAPKPVRQATLFTMIVLIGAAGSSHVFAGNERGSLQILAERQAPAPKRGSKASNFTIIAGNPPADEHLAKPEPELTPDAEDSPDIPSPSFAMPGEKAGPPVPDAVPHDPEQRKVRVVGPGFLPDPEGAIDLQAPVQKQVR